MSLFNLEHRLHLLNAQFHPLLARQQLGRLEHVLDLSPVHLVARQAIQIRIREGVFLPSTGRGFGRSSLYEIGPNVAAGRERELLVFHADMNARLESSVDVFDPIRRKEEDTFVVFENPQKDCFGRSL